MNILFSAGRNLLIVASQLIMVRHRTVAIQSIGFRLMLGLLIANYAPTNCAPAWGIEGARVPSGSRAPRQIQVRFTPIPGDEKVARRFQLPPHTFIAEEKSFPKVSDRISISTVTFPSPVETEIVANNTVHCEYYRPSGKDRYGAVVVLHILGGDFPLARVFANSIAQNGTAALFLKLPYYGPRRDSMSPRRMISHDPEETVAGMTQAVLDIRRATAFLASQPEVDANDLGVFGISLGGITGSLAAGNEPRLNSVCVLLAGGDIGSVVWDSRELRGARQFWEASGRAPEEFFALMKTIDPVTYAKNVRDRRVLMLNATHDEVIPKACTTSLWREFGEPRIVWYEGGHYSVARHIFGALHEVTTFFRESTQEP